MEIAYLGANCVRISTKGAALMTDPTVPGLKVNTKKADILLATYDQPIKAGEEQLMLDTPGEYEAKGISIRGVAARAHMDEEGGMGATIFRILINDFRVVVTGHIHPELNDEQMEALGMVDLLIIPVGGFGYTMDAESAAKVVRSIEPKVVVPTHYSDPAIKYEVNQAELKLFVDELGVSVEQHDRYKVKAGQLPEQLTVVELQRTS